MFEYEVVIRYDKNDKIYVANIPDLRGCMAHGDTPEEAIKELSIAYGLWIDVAREVGKEIPEPTRIRSS